MTDEARKLCRHRIAFTVLATLGGGGTLPIMEIRKACREDAEELCALSRRSITELCQADHQEDPPTISLWLANKTAENMRRWIAQTYVFVATEHGRIVGVGAITDSGEITLNYVSPDTR